MKGISCIALTLILAFSLVSGCDKVDTAISDVENCSDGILNNGEREIDCGGSNCQSCPAKMTAMVNGAEWKLSGATIFSQVNPAGNSIFLTGTDSSLNSISLIHTGPFQEGTYTLTSGLYSTPQQNYTSTQGDLIILEWDSEERFISGQFSFDAVNTIGDTIRIQEGYFAFAPY